LFMMFPSPVYLRALSPSERVRNVSASAAKRVGAAVGTAAHTTAAIV
jgi:hypothetical protein